ncbi:glyoxalase-like domain-containing protein [Immersiella caudata]|uniref:Glyoxalase-like domain-containing protein n=1 Tax=Immersiella caudata TaxID=314043 RepID=A0AA39TH54_9PEZI|nr:glyoxalase-like domain-containing protein [Immersiella caudata]
MAIALDHIVILLPHSTLTDLPTWLTDAFTITPGGRHSNNITENKLILFQDGVYIDLIAFVEGTTPNTRESTRWGRRVEGEIVDFALTLLARDNGSGEGFKFDPEKAFKDGVQKKVAATGTGFEYLDPAAGGRITPDGTELRWAVAVPRDDDGSGLVEGELPFWCLDRTPRDLRVPFRSRPGAARHSSGVIGVAGVGLGVNGDVEGRLVQAYESFLKGVSGIRGCNVWGLGVPERDRQGLATTLAIKASVDAIAGRTANISIKLFTTGPSKVISGEIAPGRLLSIELIHTNPR